MPSPQHTPSRLAIPGILFFGIISFTLGDYNLRGTLNSILDCNVEGEEVEKGVPDIIPVNTTSANTSTTMTRELQLTSVQSFINSYEVGNRFNDTPPVGVTGPVPEGRNPQIAHSPASGGGPGIVFGGNSQPGAPGIAGGGISGLGT